LLHILTLVVGVVIVVVGVVLLVVVGCQNNGLKHETKFKAKQKNEVL